MTTLTFPADLTPNQVTWHLEPNTSVFISPLTRSIQTLELAGARWVCDMSLPPMQSANWHRYTAWLAKMRGQAGRVYFGPPHYRHPSAPAWLPNLSALTADNDTAPTADDTTTTVDQENRIAWGTPVVRGAGQIGITLRTEGWVNSITVLKAGDFISFETTRGPELHMVVDDAVSTGHGLAILRLEPPIRVAPANGALIEIERPVCTMALQESMSGAPSFTPYLKASVNVQLVEVF
jgi:hypothetical protein